MKTILDLTLPNVDDLSAGQLRLLVTFVRVMSQDNWIYGKPSGYPNGSYYRDIVALLDLGFLIKEGGYLRVNKNFAQWAKDG